MGWIGGDTNEQVMAMFDSFFFRAGDGIRDGHVTGVQTCALPISRSQNRNQARSTWLRRLNMAAPSMGYNYRETIGPLVARARKKCQGVVRGARRVSEGYDQ